MPSPIRPSAASETRETYARHLDTLRAPPPSLTDGLALDADQRAQVDAAITAVAEQGYCIIHGFLDAQAIATACAALAPIFARTSNRTVRFRDGLQSLQTVHVHNLLGRTRAADDMLLQPVLLHTVSGILGPDFQLSVAVASCPGPGADAQGLHQDDGHFPVPRPHPPLVANTLIALDDFTAENGATLLVPGTHRSTAAVDAKAATIRAEMPAGSIMFWDGALWHAGGANRTQDRTRRSINLNFNQAWLRQQENQYIGVPRDVVTRMPERLQRLIGYRRTRTTAGSVSYQDPLAYFLQHCV